MDYHIYLNTPRKVYDELKYLAKLEAIHDPSAGFIIRPYSKRRARLVKMYWAMMRAKQAQHKRA